MLESLNRNETFEYQKLSQDEMKSRGILGRLVGPCADFINPTRNGRKYGEDLWEKVFEDPIMLEKIENGVCFGELCHPADRTETDMEKIAICLREKPKKNKEGKLIACFDILDTPNGRILKTLCDYGSTVGVSSRGTGDVIEDEDGGEIVDPDTYECECWDVVLVPAVKEARMKYVTESLDKNVLNLKKALCESLNKATDADKKVMEETLHNLGLNVETQEDILTESKSSEQTIEKTEEAINDGSEEVIKSLQEAIKGRSASEAKVKSLQEQLAVSDTEVKRLKEELSRYKSGMTRLSTIANVSKDLEKKVSTLEEELKVKRQTIERQASRISSLVEGIKKDSEYKGSLNESIADKDKTISTLNEKLNAQKSEYEMTINQLNESIESLKSDSSSKEKDYLSKLNRSEKLKESYKSMANKVVNHYIESKATLLGVTSTEIKNRLPESYTIDDIDAICENLQTYALNISKLPFSIDRKVKVKVTESKNESLRVSNGADDDIDDELLSLAGLNK